MEIVKGEKGVTASHQSDFPLTATCTCGGEGRIAFVAYEKGGIDGPGDICQMHNNEPGNMWVHDVIAVAVYLCRKCLRPTAIGNQG